MRVLVTGASKGLGRALSEVCIGESYRVVGVSRNRTDDTGDFATYLEADLSCREGLDFLKKELATRYSNEPFDLVIHNLGVNRATPFLKSKFHDLEEMLWANIVTPMELTQFLISNELMKPKGSFVFINSMSHFLSYPGSSFYAATKDGLHSFVRSLDVTFSGVYHFMQVYPGPMDTDQAKENSPKDSSSHRQSPKVVAQLILDGIRKEKRCLIPGFRNKLFFLVSRFAPGMMEKIMKKVILDQGGR